MTKRIVLIIICILIAAAIIVGLVIWRQRAPSHGLTLYGNVDVRQVDMSFRVGGRVVIMPFQEGDLVMQGELMATIEEQPYADLVREAEAAVESAERSLINAELILKRRAELIGTGAVSDEDYQNALTSRDVAIATLKETRAALGVAMKNLADTIMHAPSEGTILTRIREPGSVVDVSVPIYTLSLLDPIWVRAYVSETQLGLIYPGMAAEVFTDAGKHYDGHIGFISPVSEFTPKTVETASLRTDLVYRLRIICDNPDKYLKQGMPVTVKLKERRE